MHSVYLFSKNQILLVEPKASSKLSKIIFLYGVSNI
jgi:hypothetical protein